LADGEINSAAAMRLAMRRFTEPENRADYAELAKLCLWEADRTLDRAAAESLRSLAYRFKQLAERPARNGEAER
jgi:hypothetical protein